MHKRRPAQPITTLPWRCGRPRRWCVDDRYAASSIRWWIRRIIPRIGVGRWRILIRPIVRRGGSAIPVGPPRSATRHAGERQRRERHADDVHKHRSRAVGAAKVSLQQRTSKLSSSPSSFGFFSSTTASRTDAPSLLRTETVAFGGSLAKLPSLHSSSRCCVRRWPAALTGRSAKTMELWLMPVSVSVVPCRIAPRAFMTKSEGTMSTLTDDEPGGGGPAPEPARQQRQPRKERLSQSADFAGVVIAQTGFLPSHGCQSSAE